MLIKVWIFISQNIVRILQYTYYTHDSVEIYVKNARVSGPDKTLKSWDSEC